MTTDSPLQAPVGTERAAPREAGVEAPGAVKSAIEAALERSAVSHAQSVGVTVHGSDVTLSGTVRSWDERYTASHIAWGTPGVRLVIDLMSLAP